MNNKMVRTMQGKMGILAVAAMMALGLASVAQAAIYNITGDVADSTAQDDAPFDGVGNSAGGGLSDGDINVIGVPDVVRRVWIVPFDLPALGVDPISAATATMVLRHYGGTAANFNIDLYGLTRTSASATVLASDYFAGALDGANTLLEDNFLTPSTGINVNESHSSSGAGLISWLNTQYAAFGVNDFNGNDDFVFLRFSIDSTVPQPDGAYTVATADHATASFRPLLTIETVPEPTSIALLGLGGLLLWRRKGRNS